MKRTTRYQACWMELLLRYRWDWFVTLTFRDEVHPESADKRYRVFVSKLNRQIYGNHWHKKKYGGIHWARGLELQKRGVIHFHAMFSGERDLNTMYRRLDAMDLWNELAGFARIEAVTSQEAVAGYVSKYITKGGEIDISKNVLARPLLYSVRAVGPTITSQDTAPALTRA